MPSPEESLKKEFMLGVNEFNTSKSVEGLEALAYLIQSLLLIEPGTYPNNPDLGVGIHLYEFEILDNPTIDEISTKIEMQINKYIPNINLDSVIVEALPNQKNIENTLGVMIRLKHDGISETFVILLSKNKTNGNIIPKIVI